MSTFDEMVTELSDRGFAHLSTARRGVIVNRAYHRLNMIYLWPYREAQGTGVSPVSISDLGQVEAVTNEDLEYELEESTYKDLVSDFGDLSRTGTPAYWYRASVAGVPTVITYPSNTATIGVQYWSVPAELSGTDTPLVPERYHPLIMDMAQQAAERERANMAVVQALQSDIDRQVAEMGDDLLAQQSPRHTHITGASEDG